MKTEEEIKTDVRFDPATETTLPIQYPVTKYYIIVRYKNALDGVDTIQVRESTYNKYNVGDLVKVRISECYFDADDMYYLASYELKVVSE